MPSHNISPDTLERYFALVPWPSVISRIARAHDGQLLFSTWGHWRTPDLNFELVRGRQDPEGGPRTKVQLLASRIAADSDVREVAWRSLHPVAAEAMVDPERDPQGEGLRADLRADFERQKGGVPMVNYWGKWKGRRGARGMGGGGGSVNYSGGGSGSGSGSGNGCGNGLGSDGRGELVKAEGKSARVLLLSTLY